VAQQEEHEQLQRAPVSVPLPPLLPPPPPPSTMLHDTQVPSGRVQIVSQAPQPARAAGTSATLESNTLAGKSNIAAASPPFTVRSRDINTSSIRVSPVGDRNAL
jgi:hypothetical protein